MNRQKKSSIESISKFKKNSKNSDQALAQVIPPIESTEQKKEGKRSIMENQILHLSQSSVSSFDSNNHEEAEVEVKEKGFKNYFENYYTNQGGETIFKEYFKPQVLAKELKKNKLKISDLTITKYNSSIIQREDDKNGYSYFNDNMNHQAFLKSIGTLKVHFAPIFSLPRIQYSDIEKKIEQVQNLDKEAKTTKHHHHHHPLQTIDKIGSGFVSFERIKDMNGILLQSVEQDYEKSIEEQNEAMNLIKETKTLFLNRDQNNQSSNHSHSNYYDTKSFMEKSFNQIGDKNYIKNSYYSTKEKLQYTLQHNKFHEKQLKKFDEKEQLKSLNRLSNIIEHQQKILTKQQYRKYPSQQNGNNYPSISKLPLFLSQLHSQGDQSSGLTTERHDVFPPPPSQAQVPKDSQVQDFKRISFNNSPQSSRSIGTMRSSMFSPDSIARQSILKNSQKNIQKASSPKQKKEKAKVNINLYPCFIIKNEQISWKPEVRELFKIAYNGQTVYMFGGCSSKPMGDICSFDIPSNKWKLNHQLEDGRYNHMMVMYKKNVIIFGGEKLVGQYEQKSKNVIYKIEKNEWKYMRPTGDIIEQRRNSACCVVGKYMLIQGGINQKGMFLNDLWILDILNHRWNSGQHEDKHNFMGEGRAFHKMCTVFHPDRKSPDLFKDLTEKMSEKASQEIKHEGVYFFGGQSQKGEANNQLTILVTQTRPMYFIQPDTIGKKPDSRYNHSLTFNTKLKIVVVYGGMNENLQSEQTFFDDLFILQLHDMQWFECATTRQGFQKRANHEAVCYNSQLFIFGGIGEKGYYSFEVYQIELDKNASRSYIIEEQEKEERSRQRKSQLITRSSVLASQKKQEKAEQHEKFIKILQNEREQIKSRVDKLNYKNYKSFLPLPVIFIRKKENSISLNMEQMQQKKEELDQEMDEHIETDRKINEEIIKNSAGSSPSPKGSRTPKLQYSSTISFSDQKQLTLIRSPSERTQKQGGGQQDASVSMLQIPK